MNAYKVVISKEAPPYRGVLWAKPEKDSFKLYLQDGGTWKPLSTGESNKEDTKKEIVAAAKKAIIGSSKDNRKKLTLYGLRAYVNGLFAEDD